jgi:uncharacterized membrane protein
MKLASAAALFGMVVAFAGCSQESSPGGPGASSATKMNTSTTTTPTSSTSVTTTANKPVPVITDKNNTFTLKVPEMTTAVRPGKKEEVTISISRGSAFKESVKLQFRAPKGVTITPAEPVIAAGQDKVNITVQSTKDATVGKANIEVMAIPESGRSVSLEMPIELKQS